MEINIIPRKRHKYENQPIIRIYNMNTNAIVVATSMSVELRNVKNVHLLSNAITIDNSIKTICYHNNLPIYHHITLRTLSETTPVECEDDYETGYTASYSAKNTHIYMHTFPENNHATFYIYSTDMRERHKFYFDIFDFLVQVFDSDHRSECINITEHTGSPSSI